MNTKLETLRSARIAMGRTMEQHRRQARIAAYRAMSAEREAFTAELERAAHYIINETTDEELAAMLAKVSDLEIVAGLPGS